MSLMNVGFEENELFPAFVSPDTRISIDATVDGEAKLLTIATCIQGPLLLFEEYVRERAFPVLDWEAPFGTCFVEEITVMGRTLSGLEARFAHLGTQSIPTKTDYVGWLGNDFLPVG